MDELAVNIITIPEASHRGHKLTVEELAVEHDHNCQDKLPVEELSLIEDKLPVLGSR